RNENLKLYDAAIENDFWKMPVADDASFVSNFAYPVISPHIEDIIAALTKEGVETRPLVAGSIGQQPFWQDLYGAQSFAFADKVHAMGFYLPNNPDLTPEEIKFIAGIVNRFTKKTLSQTA